MANSQLSEELFEF